MGRKGTSKCKKAKQKATGDSGSSVLKEINQPEKVVGWVGARLRQKAIINSKRLSRIF